MKLLATIHQYDVSMFTWFMARKRRVLFTEVGRWISKSGDGYLYAVLGIYLLASGSPMDRVFLITGLVAFGLERLVYFVVKNGFKRNRPQEALSGFRSFVIPSDRFSFPSGHTSAAFLTATLIGYFYPGLAIPAYMWAACVGLSRIFLGVHFPSDILVGMTMGVGIAALSLRILAS